MKILITGANGFIGSALTKKMLELGHEVFALVTDFDELKSIKSRKLHLFRLFFDDYNSIAAEVGTSIDVAYHFAWEGLCGQAAVDVDLQLNNVKATNTLLIELKKLGLKKFVFASSMNVLEVRSFLNNPSRFATRGVYVHVASKLNAEIIARIFCERNNIEFNEGIIAMAYGEGNKSKMIPNIFIYNLLNGIDSKLVTGNNQYDLIYISDIVSAFEHIGLRGLDKKTYYIGHAWNKTFKDIFTEIKDILNPNYKIVFGGFSEDNLVDFSCINRNELTIDTGWKPSADFRESIIQTASWIRDSGFKP